MTNLTTLQTNLNKAIEASGLTVNGFAKAAGVNQSTLFRTLRGQTKPNNLFLATVANYLNTTIQDLQGTNLLEDRLVGSIKTNKQPIPLIAVSDLSEWDEAVVADNYINAPFGAPNCSIVAVTIKDSALTPEIIPGDVLYLRPVQDDEDGLKGFRDGLICAGITTDINGKEQVVVRKVLNESEGRVWLRATNPEWPGKRDVLCERIVAVGLSITRKLV